VEYEAVALAGCATPLAGPTPSWTSRHAQLWRSSNAGVKANPEIVDRVLHIHGGNGLTRGNCRSSAGTREAALLRIYEGPTRSTSRTISRNLIKGPPSVSGLSRLTELLLKQCSPLKLASTLFSLASSALVM